MVTSQNISINKGFKEFVPFFPQMKPEKKKIALSETAKEVMEILLKTEKLALNDLKEKSGLFNKKWDKSIKELTKNNLAKVEKTEEGLFVALV